MPLDWVATLIVSNKEIPNHSSMGIYKTADTRGIQIGNHIHIRMNTKGTVIAHITDMNGVVHTIPLEQI